MKSSVLLIIITFFNSIIRYFRKVIRFGSLVKRTFEYFIKYSFNPSLSVRDDTSSESSRRVISLRKYLQQAICLPRDIGEIACLLDL